MLAERDGGNWVGLGWKGGREKGEKNEDERSWRRMKKERKERGRRRKKEDSEKSVWRRQKGVDTSRRNISGGNSSCERKCDCAAAVIARRNRSRDCPERVYLQKEINSVRGKAE